MVAVATIAAHRLFTRCAPDAIADAGRGAREDLDHVLGILRDGPADERRARADSRPAGAQQIRRRQSARGVRGVAGMAERVRVLRGKLVAGREDGAWRVAARLSWPAGPGSGT